MRIWVIGKRGMLAQAVQRACRFQGIDFVATTRKELDLENEDAVRAQFNTLLFTHIINCAAYTDVDRAEEEEERAHAVNGKAVALLAKLSQEKGNRLIHFSTDYVFDGSKGVYEEGDERSPLSVYGKSKELGERSLLDHYPDALLIRTSWLFGREGKNFVKRIAQLVDKREKLRVVHDQWGRPTYADDLARAALSILDASGIYHFANRGETNWFGLAQFIWEKLREQKKLCCTEIEPISSQDFGAQAKRPSSSILLTKHFSPPHWSRGVEEVLSDAFAAE